MANRSSQNSFIIGSRASQLAQIQTNIVKAALEAAHPNNSFEVKLMTTQGDKNQSQALYLLGGKSLWTKELEVELLDGHIDLIVHSLKDVPTTLPDGCELGAILEREDARDCLVVKKGLDYKALEEMPQGSVIGTSSVRRVAMLRRLFPALQFHDVVSSLQKNNDTNF
jgi:hydroxymethylbilane synthase